jgi:hypothetical protein
MMRISQRRGTEGGLKREGGLRRGDGLKREDS